MVGDEYSLKISAPQLLRFGIDSVLKILNERMTGPIRDELEGTEQLYNNSVSALYFNFRDFLY